ncbi:MAG: hypothetical protein NTZ26_04980, partial [Candidatus Aminicenantes bacterium]|nr:hypothetical protein [Candidatus Aminicenantes bacterium]
MANLLTNGTFTGGRSGWTDMGGGVGYENNLIFNISYNDSPAWYSFGAKQTVSISKTAKTAKLSVWRSWSSSSGSQQNGWTYIAARIKKPNGTVVVIQDEGHEGDTSGSGNLLTNRDVLSVFDA